MTTTPCIEFTGYVNERGYGRMYYKGHNIHAHRCAYLIRYGSIPKGLVLDHLCRNRRCINTDHLEPVTIKENVLRGETIPAFNKAKTHCMRGHPLSGDNLMVVDHGKRRRCRICHVNDNKRQRGKQP